MNKDTIEVPKEVLLDLFTVVNVLIEVVAKHPPTDGELEILKYCTKVMNSINEQLNNSL